MERSVVKRIQEKSQDFPNKNNYLLAIGIDKYEELPKLNNAVKDAEDFVKLMQVRYGFPKKNITVLKDKKATEDHIEQELTHYADKLTEEDNLIVYYSGHGLFDEQLEEGYWLPVDSVQGKRSTYLSNANLVTYLSAIKTHHTVIISDSCFSGSLLDRSRSTDIIPANFKFASRWILSSGRKEQPVSDGQLGKNSPFAASLLKNLMTVNTPTSLRALFVNIEKDLAKGAQQNPLCSHLNVKGNNWGEFVFLPNRIAEASRTEEAPEAETAMQQFAHIPQNILDWQQNLVKDIGFWPWMLIKWGTLIVVLFSIFFALYPYITAE